MQSKGLCPLKTNNGVRVKAKSPTPSKDFTRLVTCDDGRCVGNIGICRKDVTTHYNLAKVIKMSSKALVNFINHIYSRKMRKFS
jgi:hypothetical protein